MLKGRILESRMTSHCSNWLWFDALKERVISRIFTSLWAHTDSLRKISGNLPRQF